MSTSPARIVIVLLVCVSVDASFAGAQTTASRPQRRPFRGLFGPTETEERHPQQINLALTVYEAFDDNTRFETDNDLLDATLQSGRLYQGASGVLTFLRRRPRLSISATGSAGFRYYSDLREVTTSKYSGAAALDLHVSQRFRVTGSQAVSYSPYYQLAIGQAAPTLAGAEIPIVSADYSVARQKVISYASVAGATYRLGLRGSLTFGYGSQSTDFLGAPNYTSQRGGGRFDYVLNDALALRLGYGVTVSHDEASSTRVRVHNLDVGLGFQRSFMLSPRSTVALSTGTTVVSAVDGQHLQLGGNVQVQRQLSRGWRAEGAYARGVQMLENTPVPFFSGTFSGALSGLLSRRASVRAQATYSTGVATTDADKSYHSVAMTTRLDFAVSRHWAIYGEHFYYRYRFPEGLGLPTVLTDGLRRQGVRAGLAAWVPVWR